MALLQYAIILLIVVIVARHFGVKDLGAFFSSSLRVVGLGLAAIAVVMALTGRIGAGVGLGILALSLLGWDLRAMIFQALTGGRAKPTGRKSVIRTAALEIVLDHDRGIMSGRVLAGRHEGRELARLSVPELIQLRSEIASDAQSLSLIETYLDRRSPVWRENLKEDPAARQARPARPGAMTEEEAYQVLGLQPGAGEAEIREAYRRLMKAVHPDRGGSAFLAAHINEARDRLTGKHNTRST